MLGFSLLLATLPARAERNLADTPDALPGIHRIGVAGMPGPRASSAVSAGYGLTEAQEGEDGAHHRVMGSVAASVSPLTYLSIAARGDGRYDSHPDDGMGTDSGSVLDLTLIARGGAPVTPTLHLGGEFRFRLPGTEEAGESLDSPSFDAKALASYVPDVGPVIAGYAGYRFDSSESAGLDAARLRRGDRIALGVSEFDALLLGIGAAQRWGESELLVEASWDLLIGEDAPPITESPLRGTLGFRRYFDPRAALELIATADLGGRPGSLPNDPLVPIEPRISLSVGFNYRFVTPPTKAAPLPPPPPPAPPPPEAKPAEPEPPPPKPEPKFSSVRVTVVDQTGHPISDAEVVVEVHPPGEPEPARFVLPLRERNVYEAERIPLGEANVLVRADLLKDHLQSVQVVEGEVSEVEVRLEPKARGSQIRGLVRSYAGQGIAASIRIEPIGKTTQSAEDGTFEVDVPPGSYEVIIEAEGFRPQRRRLRVSEDGVTVLNADLQANTR